MIYRYFYLPDGEIIRKVENPDQSGYKLNYDYVDSEENFNINTHQFDIDSLTIIAKNNPD